MAILFSSDVLLTATEVQKRMNDLQHWQAEITSLQKQVAETHAWLNLVAKLIGPERAHQLIGDVLLPAQVSTSNEAILPSEPHPRRSPMGDEVKQFLKTQTNGATARQIIDHLLQIQEFQEAVQRNNTSVYNVLSRLVKRHELRKLGSSYYSPVAPPNENGDSEEETAVSSESSEARLSSPELNPDAPAEAAPNTQAPSIFARDPTPSIFARDPAEAAPNTQTPSIFARDPTPSIFARDPTEAAPNTQTPRINFAGPDPAAAPPEVQIQPLDLAAETEH